MRKLLRRMRYLITQRRQQAELAEEMEFHREMKERELRATGSTADDAHVGARRAFGSAALAHDEAREAWVWPWLQDMWQDVRFAARLLMKDPRFTLTAVLTLALGIAVNNTVFTIINTAVLRDVPFDEQDRLVSIGTLDSRGRELGVSYLDFNDWRASTRALSSLAAYTGRPANVSDDALAPERVQGAFVSSNTFWLLRVAPTLGRDFLPEDERPGAPSVVILGNGLWQRRYGGERSILGRTIRVNDVASTIIGVMPADFRFPFSDEVWQPLSLAPGIANAKRDNRSLNMFGRLADKQTIDQARADLGAISARMGAEYPDTNNDIRSRIAPMGERFRGDTPILMTLMGSVVFVLLIACANVANLLLARSASRSREIAIRAALGATRWQIMRQLLIECGILSALAGLMGLALSVYGVKFLGVAFDGRQPGAPASAAVTAYWVDLSMNGPVFLFLGGLCLLATLLSGLAPAWHVSRTKTNHLKEGGRGGGAGIGARRWTTSFMVAQIALTLVLLTGGGLMLRTFVTLYRSDRVIDTSGLVTGRLSLPLQKYVTSEARRQVFERLHRRLSTAPIGVTMASEMPFSWVNRTRRLVVEGQAEEPAEKLTTVFYIQADEHYFDVLGLQMIRGRSFIPADARPGQEGVIINQRLAEMFFGDRDPIGRRIRLMNGDGPAGPAVWHTIVGIAPTVPQNAGSSGRYQPVAFVPLLGGTTPAVVSLFIRSRSDIAGAVSLLREEVRALDPNLPVYWVQTMEQVFAESRFALRLMGAWFGALAVIALVLATVGLYAVTGHAVTQRTQEIGVRVALGAERHQVVWLFVRRTIVQLAIGVALGLAGALAVGQLLQTWLAGTNPRDLLTLVVVVTLLIAVAIFATLLPARRAARIEPLVALRYE